MSSSCRNLQGQLQWIWRIANSGTNLHFSCKFFMVLQSSQLPWPITPSRWIWRSVQVWRNGIVITCKMGYLATFNKVKGLIRRFSVTLDVSISGLLTKPMDRIWESLDPTSSFTCSLGIKQSVLSYCRKRKFIRNPSQTKVKYSFFSSCSMCSFSWTSDWERML